MVCGCLHGLQSQAKSSDVQGETMSTLGDHGPVSASFSFPQSLTEAYKPTSIAGFVGLEKQKRILSNLAANPKPCALLFDGAPGTGKTSMAFAFAAAINAEIHHIGSQEATLDNIKSA